MISYEMITTQVVVNVFNTHLFKFGNVLKYFQVQICKHAWFVISVSTQLLKQTRLLAFNEFHNKCLTHIVFNNIKRQCL